MRVFTLFLMIGITIIGCAFTDISSRINPERPTESYNKVLIATAFNDLELEEAIQEKIKYSLGEHEVQRSSCQELCKFNFQAACLSV